jgi:Uma2 family endonuclease
METKLYLTPRDHGRPLTLDEFRRADAREGYRYELIKGKLEVWPRPELPHDYLAGWLKGLLGDYSRNHPEVIRHVLGPACVFAPVRRVTTVLRPDLAAYPRFPANGSVAQLDWQDVSPLLVAEVLSEDTADKDLVRNRDLYLRVPSIREYWILDPREGGNCPTLLVHRRRGARWQRTITVAGGDTYTTRLLPDFALVLDARGRQD